MTDIGIKIGLKLFSTNTHRIDEAQALFDQAGCDYIELYAIPGSFSSCFEKWRMVTAPFVVHAAHFGHGINLANPENVLQNKQNFEDAQRFADSLAADLIIVHGGNGGTLQETVRQLREIDDERIAIENKPKLGLNGKTCIGWAPEHFDEFLEAGVLHHMALDFVHSVCAANSEGVDPIVWTENFLRFSPDIFHLVDGDGVSETDHHLNLGQGKLPIRRFLAMVPQNGRVTLETPRRDENGLRDFIDDVAYIRALMKSGGNER